MSWDVVLFDLDGTLTDSGLGVGNGVLYTLEKMGYPKPNDAELKKYLGPPLWTSFQDYAGMPESDTPEAVRLYREYYNETGAFENSVYPGIPELLTKLNADGKRLAVATSKVDYAALAILRHFNLDHHFDVIAGIENVRRDINRDDRGPGTRYLGCQRAWNPGHRSPLRIWRSGRT
jgi:phosphoglycolate phosphatase